MIDVREPRPTMTATEYISRVEARKHRPSQHVNGDPIWAVVDGHGAAGRRDNMVQSAGRGSHHRHRRLEQGWEQGVPDDVLIARRERARRQAPQAGPDHAGKSGSRSYFMGM